MHKTVYIDTSVICHLTDPPSGKLITRACQELTRQWWAQRCVPELTYVSDTVIREIMTGNPQRVEQRLDIANRLIRLPGNEKIDTFAELLILGGGLTAKSWGPAQHLASAALRELDIFLTWNCVDIANAEKFRVLRQLMGLKDLELPELATPFAQMENSYEDTQY